MSFLDIKLRLKALDQESKESREAEQKIKHDHRMLDDDGPHIHKHLVEQRVQFRAEHLAKLQRVQHQRRFHQRLKARYTGLAYGILRGTKYRDIENHVREYNEPSSFQVWFTLKTFGYEEVGQQEVQAWLAEAERV